MGLTKSAAPEHLPKGIRVDDVVNSASSTLRSRIVSGAASRTRLSCISEAQGNLRISGYEIDGSYYSRNSIFDFRGAATLGLTPDSQAVERATTFINSNIERGLLNPIVDRVFKLDDIVAAHRYVESGVQIGKIVVTTR
jgi:NADPH:quinone reductase-like Zn-dependent oxidoreductase